MNPRPVHDRQGRVISYLRLSVTDLCNLRCTYCMPAEGVAKLPHQQVLRLEEMAEAVQAAAALGVSKVRITGGEPLVRRGLLWLVQEVASTPGIREVALTTNGTLLAPMAGPLAQAGLHRINLSLDTVDPQLYARVTRRGKLEDALAGLDAALEHGFPVKLNAVLLQEHLQQGRLEALVRFAARSDLQLRWIEQMTFDSDGAFVSEQQALDRLARTWQLQPDTSSRSHVRAYRVGPVRVGFISPRSHGFCSSCDKLRLTSSGQLRPCLASKAYVDLRAVLRRPHTQADLEATIREAIAAKPASGPWGEGDNEMWRVGG